MGWFDKKASDLDDLDDPQPRPAAKPVAAKPAAAKPAAAKPAAAKPAAAKPAAKAASSAKSGFGIEKAIELMRSLPDNNEALVVSVVRTTLESTNVSVEAIIDDAEMKTARIENRVDSLKKEIKDHEEEIAARREEISRLEADHRETTKVQKKLELSLKADAEAAKPAAAKAAAAKPAVSVPKKAEASGFTAPKLTTGSHSITAPKSGSLPGVK
jgi:peptidoglycan hydrolase CwlO-like protein